MTRPESEIPSVQRALDRLKSLGSVAEMRAAAERGLAPGSRPRVNSHIHLPPNFSAFESVRQAIDLAAEQGIGVLGVSNYYDYDVYGDFVELARQRGIFPLFGLEIICLIDELVKGGIKINDPGNPGKMYICGKGITRFAPFNSVAQKLINIIRRNDSTRIAEMIRRMEAIFAERGLAAGLSEDAVIAMVVRRHGVPRSRVYLQERHAAQAFQEALFARVPPAQRPDALARVFGAAPGSADDPVKVQNDIRSYLMKAGKPAFVEETFVSFEQAHRLILELGGIPCYPTLADGTRPICPFEDPVDRLVESIKSLRIFCAEFIPIRNTPQVLSHYVRAMRAAGLVVTAGTEHNTLDLLPIEPTCLNGQPIPEDLKDIFWEGACVVAAHQFLTLHGECGFVDARGNPNPTFKTTEQRIESFRKLGAAVVQQYFSASSAPLR